MTCRRQESDLTEILDHIDPETFLDYEGVKFKRTFGSSGSQLNLKECPRCGGCSWKVYLNAETGLGNCFHGSCVGEDGFNLFSFAKHLWGLDARDTIQKLKDYARDQGWIAKKTQGAAVDLSYVEAKLPDSVALPYKGVLPKYLVKRGITQDIANFFNIHYCHKGAFVYVDSEGRKRWQNYDRRILIPVFDLDGNLVTFQGRDITGESEKKYLFPPGLPGTARFLYNGHNAIGAETIVMCEGAFDVWAVKMALDERVELRKVAQVGSFGKHLSGGSKDGRDQLGALVSLKSFGLKTVVIMWDGEGAAIRSAIDAAKMIRSVGINVKIALLPPDKDPNEVSADEVIRAFYTAERPQSSNVIKAMLSRRKR